MNNYKKIKYLFDNGYYAVKRSGFVYKLKHAGKKSVPELILPRETRTGYLIIRLRMPRQETITESVHRVVWYYFNGKIKKGLQINHKNCIKKDCRLENLELLTGSQNMKHAYLNGAANQKGSKNNFSKLTEKDVIEIRKKYVWRGTGENSSKFLCKKFKISKAALNLITLKRTWCHV